MSTEQAAALIGLAVYFGMRVIDALLPTGRHFKFVERWTSSSSGKEKEQNDEP